MIDRVYAAALGEVTWDSFLYALRQIVPNGKSVLFIHDAVTGAGGFPLSSGMDPERIDAYDTYYSKLNPWMHGASIRPLGLVVQADEMLPRRQLRRTEYYNDYLRPQGIETAFGVTIHRDAGCNFLLSVMCDDIDPSTAAIVKSHLGSLVPHLRRVYRYHRSMPGSGAGLFGSAPSIRQLNLGIVHVGPGLRVRFTNDAAVQVLHPSRGVWIDAARRLRCCNQLVLQHIEEGLACWVRRQTPPTAMEYLLRGGNGSTLRASVLSPQATREELFFRGPECILVLEQPRRNLVSTGDQIGKIWGLTPTETRLALALVQGSSLSNAADQLGIGVGTARTHLKSVFRKTGTHRQGELIALLAHPAGQT